MKNLTILIFALLFVQLTAFSQSCLPEGIEFSFQIQIDNFQTNYPNCTEIEGGVIIAGDNITNLDGLNVLTSIGGNLEIGYTHIFGAVGNLLLPSLVGLDNLTSIGGNLQILDNENLISLSGLENLTSVGGDLTIGMPFNGLYNAGNHFLPSLTGLEGLTTIGGNLLIGDNDALTSLSGLEGLTTVGGMFDIAHNESLTSLTGLEGLISIGDQLSIGDNAALASLTGIENLTSIDGELNIGYSGWLVPQIGNPSLTSLAGLDNIQAESINDLIISNNSSLSTCEVNSVCSYLSSPNGTIEIHDNAPGCNSPEEVDSLCNIVSVQELSIDNTFTISPNPLNSTTLIQYTLHQNSSVTLKIHDLSGRLVVTLVDEVQQQGEQKIEFNTTGLPAGVCFCTLITNNGIQTIKLIKQ